MSDTSISLSKEEKIAAITNPEYTGNERTSERRYPPVINILQSDKQYDAFSEEDALQITKAMYGKLFIRRDQNYLTDLKDVISGVVLKIESGYEVLEEVDGKTKIVGSGTPMIGKNSKDAWNRENPGKKYRNMVKIVLSPETDANKVEQKIAEGGMPLVMLTIKGNAWGKWFEAQKQMDSVAMASSMYGHKKAGQLLVSAFKFEISAVKEKSEEGYEYYVPVVKVSLNDVETAYGFNAMVFKMKDLSLFYRVAEAIKQQDEKSIPYNEGSDNTDVVEESGLLD
jgi:hypothetical protein